VSGKARSVGSAPGAQREAGEAVRGERTTALVNAAQSLQARLSNVLAAGLMIVLGLGALSWYYAQALTRQSQARRSAESTTVSRAQGELPLPSLGPIMPPASAGTPPLPSDPPSSGAPSAAPDLALVEARARAAAGAAGGDYSGAASVKTPAELALERRLSGGVFARESDSAAAAPPEPVPSAAVASAAALARDAPANLRPVNDRPDQPLAALFTPTVTTAARAELLPSARFLLPKGAFIDCTLETAIDSTLPGMTTCITAADTFGADGKVVLLERGTKLVGETRGQVQQGQARVFVLWTQARTPSGVMVPLDSPGTDELGRAGLPGEVERHFWQRFGAAILVSLVDGAVQAAVLAASSHAPAAVIYAPGGSQEVFTEVLKDTIHIPPTVIKHNGDRIQVLVARDLDFRSVYELSSSVAGH